MHGKVRIVIERNHIMGKVFVGILGAIINIAIFSGIAYLFIFVLGAPGSGFAATVLSISFLGGLIEIAVAAIALVISKTVSTHVMSAILSRNDAMYITCGVITIAFAAIAFIYSRVTGCVSLWYGVIFTIAFVFDGIAIMSDKE